jgi:iron complex transport system substrate-binding protein
MPTLIEHAGVRPDVRARNGFVAGAVVIALVLSGCGSGSGSSSATSPLSTSVGGTPGQVDDSSDEPVVTAAPDPTSAVTASETTEPTASTEAVDLPERIVALAEEFLLADLLALGVRPVASTSNTPDGFLGIDPQRTDGIEPIFSPEFNLERLASLRPDLLLVTPSYLALDVVSLDDLERIAPTIVIGTADDDWRAALLATGEALDLADRAADLVADVDARLSSAASTLGGRSLSVVSVSPGPLVRAYTDGRTTLTEVLAELGVEFRPDDTTPGADDNGRVTLSLEQLALLDADALVLLQSDAVPGESDALAEVSSAALWQNLPAVSSGVVIELDRLAYPGAVGLADFVDDLVTALEAA